MLALAPLKAQAHALGFNALGVAPAHQADQFGAYWAWIEAGMHGEMQYLARPDRVARRRDLNVILPGVQSIIMVGLDYGTYSVDDDIRQNPLRGRVAAYAWGVDYHDVLLPRLEELAAWVSAQSGGPVRHRAYVDTGPILERAHAQAAGLGFIGKNTMLIDPRGGSSFFLGAILTTAPFATYSPPHRATQCGSCTRCLTACPTNAFPKPYVLDARRCISYLTIEFEGWIDHELRPLMGNWLWGCDVCREVCPWERFAEPTHEMAFYPRMAELAAPFLADWLSMSEAMFNDRFRRTPMHRAGHAQLVRNACVAAGNSHAPELGPYVEDLLTDPHPLVRGHAAWALAQLRGASAFTQLRAALAEETDPAAQADMKLTLDNLAHYS